MPTSGHSLSLDLDAYNITNARKLVFTHAFGPSESSTESTWQAIIENGLTCTSSTRKDPKYVTHGLHPYKGKFYPQLAKGLINLSGLRPDASILDPFCGSGTTILEGYLNGYRTFGCDMHPLAAKIAKAKIGILDVNPDLVREAVGALAGRIERVPTHLPEGWDQIPEHCVAEIINWFPQPVITKLNWLLRAIRGVSEGVIRDFFEVLVSSIIRQVSQQDPNDLRIRRRKEPIEDADVLGLYMGALDTQYHCIHRFWSVRGYSPARFRPCRVVEADSRQESTFVSLGLDASSIDLILTSPPYATALPYIDTDRLSLLILFGMDASRRRPIEHNLVGSREIVTTARRQLEEMVIDDAADLPESLRRYIQYIYGRSSTTDVGFRRKNMPALLLRFFCDMDTILRNCHTFLRPGGEAMVIVGDNRTRIDGEYERIPTTDFLQDIAIARGFDLVEKIDISVTTQNLVHLKNAITENVVLRLKRPSEQVQY